MPAFVHVTDVGSEPERATVLGELGPVTFSRQTGGGRAGPQRAWAALASPTVAELLFRWVQPSLGSVTEWPVSDDLRRVSPPLDTWRFCAAEPLLRLYRYAAGDSFATHRDEERTITPTLRSALTLLLYLPHQGTLVGGETLVGDHTIEPRPWSVLVFAHNLSHRGAEVRQGIKTVVRSDVLITRDVSAEACMGQG